MILLLGGTSETAVLATALADAGWPVLVSLATDVSLTIGQHPLVRRRSGRLDAEGLLRLIRSEQVRVLLDAAHPYACALHAAAQEAAARATVPYLRWERAGSVLDRDVLVVRNHEEAAQVACAWGRGVLLTTGSRNLAPYVREARRTGVKLVARVLPHDESARACAEAGLPSECVIMARGPFSVEANRATIKQHDLGVVVTKDSGAAGGVPEKLEAARLEGCKVIVVGRPCAPERQDDSTFQDLDQLLAALNQWGLS